MPNILHSVIDRNFTLVASARITRDLPVNPLTAVLVTLRARDTGVITGARASLATFLAQLANLSVKFKGGDIFNASPLDTYMIDAFFLKKPPIHSVMENTATAVRFVTLMIPFGRWLYNPLECFPATRKGELQLIIDVGASLAGFDTNSLQIETVELLDSQPENFTKVTTLARTFPATGQNDIDLPLGNPLLGALLFGTTAPTAGSFNATLGQIQVLVDNVQYTYAQTQWETLHSFMRAVEPVSGYELAAHTHVENLAAAYAQNAESEVMRQARDPYRQYAYLDWDPTQDGMFNLATEGRGSVRIRATADVADAARVLPIELVALQPTG